MNVPKLGRICGRIVSFILEFLQSLIFWWKWDFKSLNENEMTHEVTSLNPIDTSKSEYLDNWMILTTDFTFYWIIIFIMFGLSCVVFWWLNLDFGSNPTYEFLDATLVASNSIFNNEYEIRNYLGGGGQGRVYQAKRRSDKKEVAIKVVLLKGHIERKYGDRELDVLLNKAKTKHPNIITAFKAWREKASTKYRVPWLNDNKYEKLFIEIEYCCGNSLQKYMDMNTLPFNSIQTILMNVVDAVEHLHSQNYVHRDIKPGNILLSNMGPIFAKLGDFGFGRFLETGEDLTPSLGTPLFASPEQENGSDYYLSTDIYSLGLVFRKMLENNCRQLVKQNDQQNFQPFNLFTDLQYDSFLKEKYPNEFELIEKMTDKDESKRPTANQVRKWISDHYNM